MPEATDPQAVGGLNVEFAADIDDDARPAVLTVLGTWDDALFGPTISVRQLPGGANNRNYVLDTGPHRYALRIANQDNDRMAVDRDSARRAQSDAATIGIAPAVLAHCAGRGHLLSEFVTGRALSVDTVGEPAVLAEIARTFGTLHAATSSCGTFDPFHDIEMWIEQAAELGEPMPENIDELRRRATEVRDALTPLDLPKLFCHNDTVPQNFLWDGSRIILVDWDYAGHSYAAFELGSFICTADLSDEQRDTFLRSYPATLDEPAHARVSLMQFVAGLREIAWVLNASSMLRGTTMVADVFYDDYLSDNMRRARQFGLGTQFAPLVSTAAHRGTSTTV